MIGTPEELEEDLKGFPVASIKGMFSRPFRMEEVIDRMTMESMNALQMLVNTEVDLILLDYEMPVVKGPFVLHPAAVDSCFVRV